MIALLAKTRDTLREFERLRALPDDIENLRKSADLENEFNASLDPDRAAFLIQNMPAGFVDSHFGAICLRKWAGSDRTGAARWMEAYPSPSPVTAQALAEDWLATDRAGLHAYLDRLPPGSWKTNLACTAGEEAFVAKLPHEVMELLEKIPQANPRRDQLCEWNVTAWAMQDHAAAVDWTNRTASPDRRQRLLAAAAIGLAQHDPAAAANWAVSQVSDTDALKNALHAVARIWAVKDPSAALRWVEQMVTGVHKDSAADGLIAILKPNENPDN